MKPWRPFCCLWKQNKKSLRAKNRGGRGGGLSQSRATMQSALWNRHDVTHQSPWWGSGRVGYSLLSFARAHKFIHTHSVTVFLFLLTCSSLHPYSFCFYVCFPFILSLFQLSGHNSILFFCYAWMCVLCIHLGVYVCAYAHPRACEWTLCGSCQPHNGTPHSSTSARWSFETPISRSFIQSNPQWMPLLGEAC